MSRSILVPLTAALALASCGERSPVTHATDDPLVVTPAHATAARERLAARLAVALADPVLRTDLATRFATSTAPEGKLQFQQLARLEGNHLLARMAGSSGAVADLLADLQAARDLELYLPVPAQRAAWQGDAGVLVATIARDGEAPVAFDATGRRTVLSPTAPPSVPVIALVPQEHDFSTPRPTFATCGSAECSGSGGDGGGERPNDPGLYLVATDFDHSFESWLKGAPEFEFHVYGTVGGKAEQLACTSEISGRDYQWNADEPSWRGEVALFTQTDIQQYLARNASGVIRIVAWEDDDQPCVPVSEGAFFNGVQKMLDDLYKQWTGAKTDPWSIKGVRSAIAAFGLAQAVRNFIAGQDDLIGFGVERSVAGWAPGTANFVLKADGGITQGSFETVYRR
jgi:hypothetical protein